MYAYGSSHQIISVCKLYDTCFSDQFGDMSVQKRAVKGHILSLSKYNNFPALVYECLQVSSS